MKYLDILSIILLLIGGINWGLVGLFDFNLVTFLFGHFPILMNLIYDLVGLAALYVIFQYNALHNRYHHPDIS